MTQKEVDRLRAIIRRGCGVELTNKQARARAIELVALARVLITWEGPEEKPKPLPE